MQNDESSNVLVVDAPDVDRFVEELLLSPTRTLPVIGVTKRKAIGFLVDPAQAASLAGERALVVAFPNDESTRRLSALLPPRLSVFAGGVRLWRPAFTRTSRESDHPLFVLRGRKEAARVLPALARLLGLDAAPPPVMSAAAPRLAQPTFVMNAPATEGPASNVSGPSTGRAGAAVKTRTGKVVLPAKVLRVSGQFIEIEADGVAGLVQSGDAPLRTLAKQLRPGQAIRVFRLKEDQQGRPAFSVQGLLPVGPGRSPATPTGPIASRPVLVEARPVPKPDSSAVTVRARGGASPPKPTEVLWATVARIADGHVHVEVAGRAGRIVEANGPLGRLAAEVTPGEKLKIRFVGSDDDGEPGYSIKGLFPDPWTRVFAQYSVGDTVHARVGKIADWGILVELLPGAAIKVHVSQLDWEHVKHPRDVVSGGDHVRVKILALDQGTRTGEASLKEGFMAEPRARLTPGPGAEPFPPVIDGAPGANLSGRMRGPGALVEKLEKQLTAARAERDALAERLKDAQDQAAELRRQLRSLESRAEERARDLDPLGSSESFLRAVRREYASQFGEGDRFDHPLAKMRVGREFLARVRALEGISIDKVVEVCAQVASDRVKDMPGRELHRLRSSDTGPGRTRASDGSAAMRCALQINTPSARRLHYWEVSTPSGRVVEFASVAVHDDLSIPE